MSSQSGEKDAIEELVERSSLGTPEAKAARASVSDETAARVVARARQLERQDAAAEQYAEESICYRTTTPRAHHHTVKAAFLAGAEWSQKHAKPPGPRAPEPDPRQSGGEGERDG